jgi:hypothetical protein
MGPILARCGCHQLLETSFADAPEARRESHFRDRSTATKLRPAELDTGVGQVRVRRESILIIEGSNQIRRRQTRCGTDLLQLDRARIVVSYEFNRTREAAMPVARQVRHRTQRPLHLRHECHCRAMFLQRLRLLIGEHVIKSIQLGVQRGCSVAIAENGRK